MVQISVSRLSRPAVRSLVPAMMLASLSLTILSCLYLLVVKPAEDRLTVAETGYTQAKNAFEQSQERRVLFERVRNAQGRLATLWQALPAQHHYAALAMAISELGKAEHVAIPGMSYHVEKSEGVLPTKATLTFRVIGDYAAIYRFIHRLETSESYLVIERLDAARADKGIRAASQRVVFHVTVATFLQPAPLPSDMS